MAYNLIYTNVYKKYIEYHIMHWLQNIAYYVEQCVCMWRDTNKIVQKTSATALYVQ